jgi:hypothetical protein
LKNIATTLVEQDARHLITLYEQDPILAEKISKTEY